MVFWNGRIVPAEQAHVRIDDAGLLHGASTFSTMLARHGRVFRLDRHLKRVADTAGLLGLAISVDPAELTGAVSAVLEANGLTDARVRLTLTPGSLTGGEPTRLVTAEPLPDYPAEWYQRGIGVVVATFKQLPGDPTFGYKTGCYLPRILARQEAAAKGFEEALWYTTDGRLAEACFCNVFLVAGGKVFTPPRDTPVLPGVVREAVLEVCDELEISCDCQTPLTVREMLAAEEMFLTSSTMGIRPVVRVERHAVGAEKPGEVTRRIREAYEKLVEKETSENSK